MAIAAINDWLNTRGDYELGVALLKQHGEPSSLDLFLFSLPETADYRAKLTSQLRELNDLSDAVITRAIEHVVTTPVVDPQDRSREIAEERAMADDPKGNLTEAMLPADLRPLRGQLRNWHGEMTYVRGSMSRIPDGMELRAAAQQVADLHAKLFAGWYRIEYWRATNQVLPPVEVRPVLDPVGKLKRLKNLRTYVCRHDNGTRVQKPEKIVAFRTELLDLEKELNAIA